MRMFATGDSFIARRLPPEDAASQDLARLFKNGDMNFTNLEVTTHNREGSPSAFSGGTWAVAPPAVLDDLKLYGFNLFNWANNHTLDYLYRGLEATEKELDARQMIHAGAGRDLAAAASPKYLETKAGRVALIGATATFHPFWAAGNRNHYIEGRPGINPLRYRTENFVTEDQMAVLKEISEATYLDAGEKLNRQEGFSKEDGKGFLFSGSLFFTEEESFQKRTPLEKDMERIKRSVREACKQSDFVIISLHSHEMKETDKHVSPEFLEEAAREFIDAGADMIIGHGPHVIRGIEIYQGKPIFYSLGNFIFQNESVAALPEDFYNTYNLDSNAPAVDGFDIRSDNGKKGLGANPAVWESVIADVQWESGEVVDIKLHPIELGYRLPRHRRGWPKRTTDTMVLETIKELSIPYGTTMMIEDGIGRIHL